MREFKGDIIPCYEENGVDLYELWLIFKKYRKLIGIITFLCILMATIYCFITPSTYKAEFVVKTNGTSAYEAKKYIDNLSSLIKSEEYASLQKEMDFAEIASIKKVSASIPRRQKDLVVITVELTDPQLIRSFEKSLISYINNITEVKKTIALKRDELQEEIAALKEQIKGLEILKQNIFKRGFLSNSKSIQIDPLQVELSIQNCREQLVKAQSELKTLQAVALAVSAVVPKIPCWPKKKLIITVAALLGLFSSVFVAFFVDWLKNAQERYKQKEIDSSND